MREPVLYFDVKKYSERKLDYYFFNEKEFINVEGFGNENNPYIILFPPPIFKNKYPFNGLKPVVYGISIYNKDIIYQCKQKINIKGKKNENNNITQIILLIFFS